MSNISVGATTTATTSVITDGAAAGEADVIGTAPTGTEQGLVTRPSPGTITASGSLTAAPSTLEITLDGRNAVAFQLTGTWSADVQAQVTLDGTNWVSVNCQSPNITATGLFAVNGYYQTLVPGAVKFRLGFSSYTSGTTVATITATSTGASSTFLQRASVVNDAASPVLLTYMEIDNSAYPGLTGYAAFAPAGGLVDANLSNGSVTEDSVGMARMSTNRNLYFQIRDAAGNERGVNVNASNEALVTASQTGTWVVNTNAGKTPAYAAISVSSSGNNTIVSADASNKIKVTSYVLVSSGTVSAKWIRGSTDISGAMPLIANTGVAINSAIGNPLLETATNEALILNLSGAVGVYGHIGYYKEA